MFIWGTDSSTHRIILRRLNLQLTIISCYSSLWSLLFYSSISQNLIDLRIWSHIWQLKTLFLELLEIIICVLWKSAKIGIHLTILVVYTFTAFHLVWIKHVVHILVYVVDWSFFLKSTSCLIKVEFCAAATFWKLACSIIWKFIN